MDKIKILIVDDMKECIEYFEEIIETQDDMEVVGAAHTGLKAIELAKELAPDIILMDIQMESLTAGINATKIITQENPEIKVIMLTVYNNDDLVIEAYMAGAVDYIVKSIANENVVDVIKKTYENDYFLGPLMVENIRKEMKNTRRKEESLLYIINYIMHLSKTEKKILMYYCKGLTRKDILSLLFIEENTLKSHTRSILKKLGYNDTKSMVKGLKQLGVDVLLKDIIK